jgi:hypothetical protein
LVSTARRFAAARVKVEILSAENVPMEDDISLNEEKRC